MSASTTLLVRFRCSDCGETLAFLETGGGDYDHAAEAADTLSRHGRVIWYRVRYGDDDEHWTGAKTEYTAAPLPMLDPRSHGSHDPWVQWDPLCRRCGRLTEGRSDTIAAAIEEFDRTGKTATVRI